MIHITRSPLDPNVVTAKVRNPTNGAVITFLGTTRLFADGRKVLGLEYETYKAMAVGELKKIIMDIKTKWQISDIAIAHRIGPVGVGEVSMVVAVASPHRKEAFTACRDLVDQIKQTVPIWKKEYFEDGHHWVSCEGH